jgi:hypothetical protein
MNSSTARRNGSLIPRASSLLICGVQNSYQSVAISFYLLLHGCLDILQSLDFVALRAILAVLFDLPSDHADHRDAGRRAIERRNPPALPPQLPARYRDSTLRGLSWGNISPRSHTGVGMPEPEDRFRAIL